MGRRSKLFFLLGAVAVCAATAWLSRPPAPAAEGGRAGVFATEQDIPLKSVASTAASPEIELSDADRRKLDVLAQIFRSKNDNDPRMDTEMRDMSPALKGALRAEYGDLPMEARNERGTIVFILGREISSAEDVAFLHSVLTEPPCLGLEDCGAVDRGDDHSQLGSDVTLAYPQLVALRSYKKYLSRADRDESLARQIQDSRAVAKSSSNPLISRAADN
jgi:hypothetical protein